MSCSSMHVTWTASGQIVTWQLHFTVPHDRFLLRVMVTHREVSRFLNLRGPKGGGFFASTIFSQYYKFLFVSYHPFRLGDPLTRLTRMVDWRLDGLTTRSNLTGNIKKGIRPLSSRARKKKKRRYPMGKSDPRRRVLLELNRTIVIMSSSFVSY